MGPEPHNSGGRHVALRSGVSDGLMSWCSCCGRRIPKGARYVKIELDESRGGRYIMTSHLVSWSSLSGNGETLPLNTYMRLEPSEDTKE